MGERPRPSELAFSFAEVIHLFLEAEYQEGRRDIDGMFMRLKDLSAFSLEHVEILDQREGVELLGLAMFFGMSSNPNLLENQRRLGLLSEETLNYKGSQENIEAEVDQRKDEETDRPDKDISSTIQRRMF
jgi:hypothetical protein